MEEINNNNTQIIVGDTPIINTQIMVGDTPINYPPNVNNEYNDNEYNVNNEYNEYDVYDEYYGYDEYNKFDEYDEFDEYVDIINNEYNDNIDENINNENINDQDEMKNTQIYYVKNPKKLQKLLNFNINFSNRNNNGETVLVYLSKQPIDEYDMFNDEDNNFDNECIIDTLLDTVIDIIDSTDDPSILIIPDSSGKSLFDITYNNYLNILNTPKKFTTSSLGNLRNIHKIEQMEDFYENNFIYNSNLNKRQTILLNRLKTIYSKLPRFLQGKYKHIYDEYLNDNDNIDDIPFTFLK